MHLQICINPCMTRGGQIDPPPKAFDTWHVYMRLNYHHFHRLFLKYCFVHFFQKKNFDGTPPGGHGGSFLKGPQTKICQF